MDETPNFQDAASALHAIEELAAQKYIRSPNARDQAQAEQRQQDAALVLREGLDAAVWDEADEPLVTRVLDAVDKFRTAFLKRTATSYESAETFDPRQAQDPEDFDRWFAGLHSRIAECGVAMNDEPRLDRCGQALDHGPVPHIGCVRTLILLCGVVPETLHPRLVLATRFVATLFFLQQLDKVAGDWTQPKRRIEAGALRESSLLKIDGLWQVAQRLRSKGL